MENKKILGDGVVTGYGTINNASFIYFVMILLFLVAP
jgi:acetyl-CoA carboxylase carboxyltransferase component